MVGVSHCGTEHTEVRACTAVSPFLGVVNGRRTGVTPSVAGVGALHTRVCERETSGLVRTIKVKPGVPVIRESLEKVKTGEVRIW